MTINNLSDNQAISLLGVQFHAFTRQELLGAILASARQSSKSTVSYVNIKSFNLAVEQPWFKQFLNSADVVFCDGVGVILAAKLSGWSINRQQRTTCPDWIAQLAQRCAQEGLSLFFLGGDEVTANTAVTQLKQTAPTLRLAAHHGYALNTPAENENMIQQINAFKPDILLVGLGTPLQEEWIHTYKHEIDARVFLAIGGCLDFFTGTVYRGPRWVTDNGLEWLARLLTEPRRLWRRYLIGNPLFFYRIFRAKWRQRWQQNRFATSVEKGKQFRD